jgi:hypothetical protein
VLCTAQAYGTTCFFIEGWKQGWKLISPDPFDFWIEFVALNGTEYPVSTSVCVSDRSVCSIALWIIIPLAMLLQSALAMRRAAIGNTVAPSAKPTKSTKTKTK